MGTLLDDENHSDGHIPSVTRQSGERRQTARAEPSSLTRKQLPFQTRDGRLGSTGEKSATVLIRSLVETFKSHWCLEPNVILRGTGWEGRSATGQRHSQFVAPAGHSVVELG